jgi:AraC-like DNA-binding protein
MCHPSWGRALTAAQRLHDLARLRRVRDRIDREDTLPLDIEALARGAGMPAGRLSHEFRLAYGRSPHAYLMSRRIEHATALLRRGEACAPAGRAPTRPAGLSPTKPAGPLPTRPAGLSPTRLVRNREALATASKLA